MYYGYNDNKELILADEEFIELLGFTSFEELNRANIISDLVFENKRIIITQEHQIINSDFSHHEMYGLKEDFYLVKLQDTNVESLKEKPAPKKLETTYKAIYLDVEKIADNIGLSVSDYKLYLDSFIDQSIIDEKRLLEGNDKVIKNLSNLALTLKIPHINILLLKIQKLSYRKRMPLIDEYYTKLALLTLERPEDYEEDDEIENILESDTNDEEHEEILNTRFTDLLKTTETKEEQEIKVEKVDSSANLIEEKKTEVLNSSDDMLLLGDDLLLDEFKEDDTLDELELENVSSPQPEKLVSLNDEVKSNEEIKKINLENITPLPISYSPQTAADELNLPVVLIEEFVDDFIEQARHDKDHLLASYYQKDMDNIHELGHKLKGAASNLRINELSDILEEIQFCTEHDKLEGLFTKYWGHFLSLEDYMKQLKRA